MPRAPRPDEAGGLYDALNRGNLRADIFRKEAGQSERTLYLHCELEKQSALLDKLGKHKSGKSCLYIKKFDDVHVPTLKKLIKTAYKSPSIAGATID